MQWYGMNWSHRIIAKPLNPLGVQFPKMGKEDYGVKSVQYLVHITYIMTIILSTYPNNILHNHMNLQKNVNSMDSCIRITRTWRILAEDQASRNSWTLNRINWTRISPDRYPDLVAVRSNQYKTLKKVSSWFS